MVKAYTPIGGFGNAPASAVLEGYTATSDVMGFKQAGTMKEPTLIARTDFLSSLTRGTVNVNGITYEHLLFSVKSNANGVMAITFYRNDFYVRNTSSDTGITLDTGVFKRSPDGSTYTLIYTPETNVAYDKNYERYITFDVTKGETFDIVIKATITNSRQQYTISNLRLMAFASPDVEVIDIS